MSSALIWSGNFRQIRSYIGSSCCFSILKSHPSFFQGKQCDPRICCLHSLASTIDRRSPSLNINGPCDVNLSVHDGSFRILKNVKKESVICGYKSAQRHQIQNIPVDKLYDMPGTVLVFDLETNGICRTRGRIIEIAIRHLFGGGSSTFQTLINPGGAVTNTKIHGISSGMVCKPGVPSFKEVIPTLLHFVRSHGGSGKPVLWIAHNGRAFDVPFLFMEFKRCSVEIPEDWFFLDTLSLARQLRKPDGSKLSSCSLDALREHYRIPLDGPAHRAMQDVDTLARVVRHISYELNLTISDLMPLAFRPAEISAKRK